MGCRTALPVHPLTCAVTAWFKSTPPSISDLDCPELQPPAVANSQHLSPVSRQAAVGHLLLPQEPPTDGWAGGFSTKEEACRLVSTHPTIITSFVRMMPFFFAVVVFVLGGGVTFRLVPPPPPSSRQVTTTPSSRWRHDWLWFCQTTCQSHSHCRSHLPVCRMAVWNNCLYRGPVLHTSRRPSSGRAGCCYRNSRSR